MYTDILRLLDMSPLVAIILMIPAVFFSALAWIVRSRLIDEGKALRGNVLIIVASALGLVVAVALAVFLSRASAGPMAVYLSEQGGELRVASLTSRSVRGGSFCDVQTWRLSDGRFIGSDTRRGQCVLSPDAAFTGKARVDLWAGQIGASIDSLLEAAWAEEASPPPGTGMWSISKRTADGVTLRLQDDSTRFLEWSTGVPATRLEPPREKIEFSELGVFDGQALGSDCGCQAPPCGTLLAFKKVAFGEGEPFVGLLDEEESDQPHLRWSHPAADLFGRTGTVFAALPDGADCLVIAGRSGGRLAVARVERQSGHFEPLWGD